MASDRVQREIDRYAARTPASRKLQQEATRYLPGGSTRTVHYHDPHPAFAARGEGNYVYDVDGNRYLDFMINATSLILGHAHPDVVRALQEQAALGTAFSGPTMAQARLAQTLCQRVPSVDSVRFTNSGTEGTLMAIRAARAFTGRSKIAKFEGDTTAPTSTWRSASSRRPAGWTRRAQRRSRSTRGSPRACWTM